MSIDSELRVDESSDVWLGDCPVDVGENESRRLIEKKDRKRNFDVNRIHHKKSLVMSELQISCLKCNMYFFMIPTISRYNMW